MVVAIVYSIAFYMKWTPEHAVTPVDLSTSKCQQVWWHDKARRELEMLFLYSYEYEF